MKKVSKIVFPILFAIVIISSIVITSFASVASDASKIPVCPVLYGAYGNSSDTYVRSTGGYASNTKHMQNSLSTWYMYCVTNANWSDLSKSANYFNIVGYDDMFKVFDSIYYGSQTANSSGVSYFNCMNTLDWYINLSYCDSNGNVLSASMSQSIEVEVTYLTSDDMYDVYYAQFYMADYLNLTNNRGWVHVNTFLQFIGMIYDDTWASENFITSVSINPYDSSVNANSLFNVFYRIPNASLFISNRTYQHNIINIGFGGYQSGYDDGYDAGYDRGFDVGYDGGYDDGESFGYEEGYIHGYDYGFDIAYDSGYDEGFTNGSDIDNFGVLGFIGSSIGGFLAIELFEGFAIGHICLVAIVVPLFIWILKIFGGG